MKKQLRQHLYRHSLSSLILVSLLAASARAFIIQRRQALHHRHLDSYASPSFYFRTGAQLFAKKKPRKVAKTGAASGFGGAATEACACGSGLAYNKCCGKLHRDPSAFASAMAEQVVRARYTAYAKRVVDFIIASTHPLNTSFKDDVQHWKKTIEESCYDNFELTKCEILDESYEGEGTAEKATVRFLAHMIQRDNKERTAFIETSTFERDEETGAWLYKEGVVDTVNEKKDAWTMN